VLHESLHGRLITAGNADCMDSLQTVESRCWPTFAANALPLPSDKEAIHQDRRFVPTNSAHSCLDNNLETALQEARIRNLEASLLAEQTDSTEQIGQLRISVQALRADVVALKRQLAESVVALGSQNEIIATRDAGLANLRAETQKWRQQADAQREDNMRLQAQLTRLVEMVRQNQNDANAANVEKDRQLGPLSQQIEALNRVISVKQRHEELVMQDLEASKRRCTALQADAATLRELVEQTRAEQQIELQQLQQPPPCRRQEELLCARCRLLQAWCIRSFRSLDAEGCSWILDSAQKPGAGHLQQQWPAAAAAAKAARRRVRGGGSGKCAKASMVQKCHASGATSELLASSDRHVSLVLGGCRVKTN